LEERRKKEKEKYRCLSSTIKGEKKGGREGKSFTSPKEGVKIQKEEKKEGNRDAPDIPCGTRRARLKRLKKKDPASVFSPFGFIFFTISLDRGWEKIENGPRKKKEEAKVNAGSG